MATIIDIMNLYTGTEAERLFTRRTVNYWFRKNDQSNLWPICGRFNATERAIRRIRKLERDGLCLESVYDYALALDDEISRIVNNEA